MKTRGGNWIVGTKKIGTGKEGIVKTHIGYKLLAADFHSRTTTYDRLYYPETGEWVHGKIYVGTSVSGSMVCLIDSLPARWLATVEYILLRPESSNIDVASQVRVIDMNNWVNYDQWTTAQLFGSEYNLCNPIGLRMALRKVASAKFTVPVFVLDEETFFRRQAPVLVDRQSRLLDCFRIEFGKVVIVGDKWLLDRGICPDTVYEGVDNSLFDV